MARRQTANVQTYSRRKPEDETRLDRANKLQYQLERERASFEGQYKDLASAYSPTRARFMLQNANRGDRRNRHIIDSTPQMALRTLVAGLISGMTNPASKWFHLRLEDRRLSERWAVKDWLETVEDRMFAFMAGTNLYQCFAEMYWDAGAYGTSPIFLEKDLEHGLHGTTFPVGSYWIGQDARRRVRIFSRKFRMTVRQIVDEFGRPDGPHGPIDWTNISETVKRQWDDGWTETWVDVCHLIQPNELYNEKKALSKFKRYASCYWELGTGSSGPGMYSEGQGPKAFLRESGYDYFPVVVARWDLAGEDVYATSSPGMTALGDARALQQMHRRKAQAVELKVKPTMNLYGSGQSGKLSTLPGDINRLGGAGGKFEPTFNVNFDITELKDSIYEHQGRIKNAFYVPLFLLFADDARTQPPTAAEIHAKQQERLLQIGPVLERFNQEVFDLLIDIVFGVMLEIVDEHGESLIPEPPEELEGMELRVQYVSVLSDAQKSAGLAGIDRFLNMLLMILKANPQAVGILDKVDLDQLIDEYAERAGVPRKIILSDERVKALRSDRDSQTKKQMVMQMVPDAAKAARDLSEADLSTDNALSRMVAARAA